MLKISLPPRKTQALAFGALAFVILAGVGIVLHNTSRASTQSPQPSTPSGISVNVQTINPQGVLTWSEFSGRMHAVDYAEIRPEVGGRITEIRFRDGQTVKAGDVLLVIDPRPYEAAVAKAEANLATAQTNAGFARTELERATNMVKTQAIAQRLYDERANANRVSQAAIQAAEADLKQARLDLEHAYVKAPIAGRVGRPEITLGNLVQTGPNAPVLTSIVSHDGIYADFEVDEQTYMKTIHANADTQAKEQKIPVELTIQGDEGHPYKGTIYSFDNHIDTGSGTIRARARFTNEDGRLMPGMFVSVKLGSNNSNALLVPEGAIGNDQSKKFVYVVGANNRVAYREVTLGQKVDGRRIVLSGLHAGERVIIDGMQQVKPDMAVEVREVAGVSDGPHKMAAN